MSEPSIVVHVLSAREAGEAKCRIRGTVRSGELRDGLELWFADGSGDRHTVVLSDLEMDGPKVRGVLEGSSSAALRSGSYLYSTGEG